MSLGPSPIRRPAPPVSDLPSPCISICRIDEAGLCEGCRRTLDEIAAWSGMDDAARRAVWQALPARGGPALPSPASPTAATASPAPLPTSAPKPTSR